MKMLHWYKFNDRGEIHVGLYMGREKGFECCVCGHGGQTHCFNVYYGNRADDYETWGYGDRHLPAVMEDIGEYSDTIIIDG